MKKIISSNMKNNIWIFNSATFSGNPKWLFIYINKYRKDIKAYWFCDSKETVSNLRNLGYMAYTFKSKHGHKIQFKADVFVVNMVKEHIPVRLVNKATILNLWHGVGCKAIEKQVNANFGFIRERTAKKYIKYYRQYKNFQLFLVTSPLMEKHFKKQCDIDDDNIIRGGYPCCMYKGEVKTFDHDILKAKGLSKNTRIAVYCPTFRDASAHNFFGKAIPDMRALIEELKEENMLLIFKMHPLMEKDYQYNSIKAHYNDCPNLLFWDNRNDIYEIFSKIDLAIVDYSSMFYDMLAAGIPYFVRYIFDYEGGDKLRDMVFDYKEMTFGEVCNDFNQLLDVFSHYRDDAYDEERKRIYDLFWSYTKEDSFEDIINATLEFTPKRGRVFPNLYSFDIFDTLIKRKALAPVSIFYYIQYNLRISDLDFPSFFYNNFVEVRRQAEANVREYYRKTVKLRNSDRLEITFDEIYDRIAYLYSLTQVQVEFLKQCEFEAEYENCIPYEENIAKLQELLAKNEKVILISDMYLPQEFVKKLLAKADPILSTLPLYLSSEIGDQKTSRKLYLKAYEDSNYHYQQWIHYGDNVFADGNMARKLAIKAVLHKIPKFNRYENSLVNNIKSYDAYLVSALFARFRTNSVTNTENYAYSYVTLYWVTYISWVLKDAVNRGTKCLYFISRDGYHLKNIADAIINVKKLSVKTKYIYGSRKAWRVPSFIDEIDEEFFMNFGNFSGVSDYENLLYALDIDEDNFAKMFPELVYLKDLEINDKETLKIISSCVKNSDEYRVYLLDKAKQEREIVSNYLKQEIDFNEKFAFVEYWGRGYTQDCLTRLLHNLSGKKFDVVFYYARSIYPTISSSVRLNYTTDTSSLIFVEVLFANLPYNSIIEYQEKDDKIVPIITERENNPRLHKALEKYLVQFCYDFYQLDLLDEDLLERELFHFALKYFNKSPNDKYIANNLGPLKDAVTLFGSDKEFAPPLTKKFLLQRLKGEHFKTKTKSIKMSLARSTMRMRKIYHFKKRLVKKIKSSKLPKSIKGKIEKII